MKKLRSLQKFTGTFILLFLSLYTFSQDRRISGVVLEGKNNTALEGASIAVKNGKASTLSKTDGKFEISIPKGKVTLSVTFVGYENASVTVGENQSNVLVKLGESSARQMEDVVVMLRCP